MSVYDLGRFGDRNPNDPEYASVEEFAEFTIDDELTTFDSTAIKVLNHRTGIKVGDIRRALEDWGLTYVPCELRQRRVRGINTSSNDRWFGKGSASCHGGSGHEQIQGFTFTKG
jgi:hypothetical protein